MHHWDRSGELTTCAPIAFSVVTSIRLEVLATSGDSARE
jgi:hypothetical protein